MQFFTKDYHNFFKKLARNNNRPWFNEHKKEYETHVKEPFTNLVTALLFQAPDIDDDVHITPKESIYRIYRDIRFSKDKTPYKTNMSATISKGGRKGNTPGIFIQLGINGLMMASGVYQPSPKTRDQVREYIIKNHDDFKKVINNKTFKTTWGELQGEKNKVLSPQFKEFLPEEPLIANKAFYVLKTIDDPNIFLDEDLDQIILKHFKSLQPFTSFLKRALHH